MVKFLCHGLNVLLWSDESASFFVGGEKSLVTDISWNTIISINIR